LAANSSAWPRRMRRIVQALTFGLFLAFIIFLPALVAGDGRAGGGYMRLSPFSGLLWLGMPPRHHAGRG